MEHFLKLFSYLICLIRLTLQTFFLGGKMTIQIRKMMASDYAAAYAFWKAMPGIGLSSADSQAAISSFLLRNPETCFIAKDDDKLVGTVLAEAMDAELPLSSGSTSRLSKTGYWKALAGICLDALHSQAFRNATSSCWRIIRVA
jgi:hypothetical protein